MDMDKNIVTLPKNGLKNCDYTIHMDMNTMTLPKKGLRTRPYSMDVNKDNHIVTLPKKGLKTRPYSMDMNKDNHIVTLPKKGLKTRPYNIGMEKEDLNTRHYSKDMNEEYLKKYDYNIYTDMEKKNLKRLTKGQLIKLLMDQRKKPTPPLRTGKWESIKPKPIPCKSVNEDLTLPPPEQFQDGYKPIPKPRTDRSLQMQNARRPPKPTRKPPPISQVEEKEHITSVSVPKIKELNQALKGHAKSYGIELQDNLNLLDHSTKTKSLVKSHLEGLLKDMKGFKFIETLEVMFEKDSIDSKTGEHASIYKTAFFNSKAKIVTKVDSIEHV